MKLGNYTMDLGRVVAYYPELNKVTGSKTATLFLCQFLYWSSRCRDDGWIYKNNYQIEDETGLTYMEQRTARKILIALGILEEEFKRIDRTMRFRINIETFNFLWEQISGNVSKVADKKEYMPEVEQPKVEESKAEKPTAEQSKIPAIKNSVARPSVSELPESDFMREKREKKEEKERRTQQTVKGDLVDAVIYYAKNDPGMEKSNAMKDIQDKLEHKLRVSFNSSRWQKFIEYVYKRQTKYNEPVEKFITWMLEQKAEGFKSTYYTPEKLEFLYPQAFAKEEDEKPFVEKLPDIPEEKWDPMPEHLKTKRKLF